MTRAAVMEQKDHLHPCSATTVCLYQCIYSAVRHIPLVCRLDAQHRLTGKTRFRYFSVHLEYCLLANMSIYDTLYTYFRYILSLISSLTLGQIFWAVYNPPTPKNLAVAAVVVAWKSPVLYSRFLQWRISRKVVYFNWPVPKVSGVVQHGLYSLSIHRPIGSESGMGWKGY
jgi:hypothetical protein